ncbi:MAG: AhpC/TSA family protein [Acidobacteria bacterium]|nr:AhpC/TSA family protein [Acidobacteriota bacterium]
MRIIRTTFLAILCSLAIGAATPDVGDEAPDFTLRSLAGEAVTFSKIAAKGPTVLIVLRGYPGYQCPVCNRQVQDFLSKADAFAEKGAEVVMIYPGPAEKLETRAAEFAEDKKFPKNFHLLLDPAYAFTNQYGLRWDAPKETAYPATFVLGPGLSIRYRLVSDSHGGRSKAADVLGELD